MLARVHLATLVDDMERLGAQAAVVEHRGVRRFRTSYAELARGAHWFAAELVRRQVEPGDRVVLWGENGAAWIACFFGCVLRGVLVVPLDATGTPAFAHRIVRETSPRLIAGDEGLLGSLSPEIAQMHLVQIEAAMHDADATVTPTMMDAGLGPDTPLQILFTSGTTGEPKGIVHTHRNLLASLTPIEREIEKYCRYERVVHPLHFLHTLPLSHVFGQFMGLWVAPVLGAVVHYESRLEASRLLRLLRQERISVLAVVPRVLGLLQAELLATNPALASQIEAAQGWKIAKRWWRFRRIHSQLGWRFWAIVCGGATLPASLEGFWNRLGVALIQGYGMTETSALVTLNHPFKPARGTLGAPLPGRELRIADTGELLVRGEMVATTTWRNSALQPAPVGGEGWLATGDLTSRDADGRLHFLGRTSQRLVTAAGLNIYLEDVEAALAAQPGVRAAVAVAVDDSQGSVPGAVLQAASPSLAAQAVEAANSLLAPHQRIVRWWLWPGLDLPRTPTGKVRRGVLEAWVREQPSSVGRVSEGVLNAAIDGSPEQDLLLRLLTNASGIASQFAGQLPPSERDRLSLESLGLDSLARVQVQAALERASGRSIQDARMVSARTLGDLRQLAGLPSAATEASFASHSHPPGEDPIQESSREPGTDAPHRQADSPGMPRPPLKFNAAAQEEPFLYLHWPWSTPLQLLRTLFLEACVRPLVWLLASPRVSYATGSAEVTQHALRISKPLLIVANHVSAYDLPLLLYALPAPLRRRIATAAAGEMMQAWRRGRGNPPGPVIYWLLTVLFNVFPLPRSQAFRRAFVHAGEALDQGYSVLIFPEGTRSHGGPMQPFRPGIGLLAQQASAQVLPVALHQSRSTQKRNLRPYAATVCIGALITIRSADDARDITTRIEQAVRRLLDSPLS